MSFTARQDSKSAAFFRTPDWFRLPDWLISHAPDFGHQASRVRSVERNIISERIRKPAVRGIALRARRGPQCRSIPTSLSGRHRWRFVPVANSVRLMTIALDARDDVVALAFPTFPTRGRDGIEVLTKGQGMPRAEPLPTALWSSHECLCWRQELPITYRRFRVRVV